MTTDEKVTLYQLERDVREAVRDEIDLDAPYPEDHVAEIVDSHVPIYNSDLLDVAAGASDMALLEPELGPAFDGSPTPINIIAANIYEALSNAAHDELREMQDEAEDSDDE